MCASITGGRNLLFTDCYFEEGTHSVTLDKAAGSDELTAAFVSPRFWGYATHGLNVDDADAVEVVGAPVFHAAASTATAAVDVDAASSAKAWVSPMAEYSNHSGTVLARTEFGVFGQTARRAGSTDDIKDALVAYGLLQGTSATPLNLDGGQLRAGTVRPAAGATGSRPDPATAGSGAMWFDTTLGQPIFSNGTTWRKADGTAA